MKDKKYNEAIETFRKCSEQNDNYFDVIFNLAKCYFMKKDSYCIHLLKYLLSKKLTPNKRFSC